MKINSWQLIVPALAAGLQTVLAGDITGTITLNGTPPEPAIIDMANFAACSAQHAEPVKTMFYVVGPNKGLKDVVVVVKDITGKSAGASAEPLVLDQKGCEYIPYVSAVQTGQKIVIKNSDPTLHNVHIMPAAEGNSSRAKNLAQSQGDSFDWSFPAPEEFLKIKCDVHAWMFSYVTVVDSPYFAVTGKDGSFKIANVPPGKHTIEIMHRKAGKITKDVEVADGSVTVDAALEVPAK